MDRRDYDRQADYAFQGARYHTIYNVWVLALNRYQRDNLLDLLSSVGGWDQGARDPALAPWNNGDWVGELIWMLGKLKSGTEGRESAVYAIDDEDRPNRRV